MKEGPTPPRTMDGSDSDEDTFIDDSDDMSLDGMVDGDRQLTTDSDAIDGGLNDSDLGMPRDALDAEDSSPDADGPGTI